jgi:hypothetical protein
MLPVQTARMRLRVLAGSKPTRERMESWKGTGSPVRTLGRMRAVMVEERWR